MSNEIILFLAVLVSLSIAAVGFVLVPLLRKPGDRGLTAKNLDVALYREQRTEIDAALTEARITLEQAEQSRNELDLRLLDDTDGSEAVEGRWLDRGPAWVAGLLLCVAMASGAGWLYHDLGAWQFVETRGMDANQLVERLAKEMQQRPDELQGWALLGGAYRGMGRFNDAAQAYAELNSRSPQAETLVAEAEMRAMGREGVWDGEPYELIEKALQLDPANGPALWYAGQAAFSESRWLAALQHWERLMRQDLPQEFRNMVQGRLSEALEYYSAMPDALVIPLSVTLDKSRRAEFDNGFPPDAALFVVARGGDGQAGGMPLAVSRLPVGEFPVNVVLHDGKAMFAERPLSGAAAWTVTARISLGGDAIPESGDLEGSIRLSAEEVRQSAGQGFAVTIDRRRE